MRMSTCHRTGRSSTAVGLLVALFIGSAGCYVGPRDSRFADQWADDYSYAGYAAILSARFSGDIRGVGKGRGSSFSGPLLGGFPWSVVAVYPSLVLNLNNGETWGERHNAAVHGLFYGGKEMTKQDRSFDLQLDMRLEIADHADETNGGEASWLCWKMGAALATKRSRPLRLHIGGGIGIGYLEFDNRLNCSGIGPYARAGVQVIVGRRVRTAIGLDCEAHHFWGDYFQSGEAVEAGVTRSAVSVTFYW